jgi:ubiquitin C-terminal hydrolase
MYSYGKYINFKLQGQFKNTVKCSECGHVSVSFEPFMYLSVPLPRANDFQIEVKNRNFFFYNYSTVYGTVGVIKIAPFAEVFV